jgi:Rps23 Pro-64 3,4-dihydroxylase Tpa1-like proline 4-hydroxylase
MIDFKINVIEDFITLEDADTFVSYIKNNCSDRTKFYTPMKHKIENKIRYESHIPERHTFLNHPEILHLLKKYSDKFLLECDLFFKDSEKIYLTAQWMTMLGPQNTLPAHIDNHKGAEHLFRSGVIYLNEDFEGGYLNFLHRDLTIKPKKLSLVIFDSREVHEITEVLSGTRIAMPIWATNIKEKEVS